MENTTEQLLAFIKNSPTAFQAVENMAEKLEGAGFVRLLESRPWQVVPGGCYYVTRNGSSIVAFRVGSELADYGFMIAASHSDSPAFKLKPNAELDVRGKYTKLNVEGYGGMICSSWLDRPLSIAGRAAVRTKGGIQMRNVCIDRDLLVIPNLAIHMDRSTNDGHAYNKQVDMLPILNGRKASPGAVRQLIADELTLTATDILDTELFLYPRTAPSVWGEGGEFVSAPRLDDLQCAFASLEGFLQGGHPNTISVFACFDNEEVGSGTKQGAAGTFLADVLQRANAALGKTAGDYHCAVANSFLVSCDNAHAVHPNFASKTDEGNCAYMNEGIVLKSSANQKYTSDGISAALFRTLCERAAVPVQVFANRSDMAGGSTLGNIAMTQVSMHAVDVGLAQLAMHSAYETAGTKDTQYLVDAMRELFSSQLREVGEGEFALTACGTKAAGA